MTKPNKLPIRGIISYSIRNAVFNSILFLAILSAVIFTYYDSDALPVYASTIEDADSAATVGNEEDDEDQYEDGLDEGESIFNTLESNIPSPFDDVVTTAENNIVTINVLENDRIGYGRDDEVLMLHSITQPTYGLAILNYDGTVTYSPFQLEAHAGLIVEDTLFYTASSGNESTFYTARVTIKVIQTNDAPIAYDASFKILKNTESTFYLNGYDDDGDNLTFLITSEPMFGSYELDSVTGRILYAPYFDWTGEDLMTFVVSDNASTSIPATILLGVSEAIDEDVAEEQVDDNSSNSELEESDNSSSYNNTGESESTAENEEQYSSDNSTEDSDMKPVANAGQSQTILSGSVVSLDGHMSIDPDGDVLSYSWSQVAGSQTVAISHANTENPTFTAPSVISGSVVLTFELTVSAGDLISDPSTVKITIIPMPGVDIDILPGIYPNEINTNKVDETIAVALLGSSTINVNSINKSSLEFGPAEVSALKTETVDIDADGFTDLISYYRIGDLGLRANDNNGCLAGMIKTNGINTTFEACDSVKITNQNKK